MLYLIEHCFYLCRKNYNNSEWVVSLQARARSKTSLSCCIIWFPVTRFSGTGNEIKSQAWSTFCTSMFWIKKQTTLFACYKSKIEKFNERCPFRKSNYFGFLCYAWGTKKKSFLTLKSDLVKEYYWLLLCNRTIFSQKHWVKFCGSYKPYTCIPMQLKCP